jgi:hypothetical protein
MLRARKNAVVAHNAPVVVLRDDIVRTRFSRRRCKFDRLEIPDLLVRGFASSRSATGLGLRRGLRTCLASVMLIRASAAFLNLVMRDSQPLHRAFGLCSTASLGGSTLHGWTSDAALRQPPSRTTRLFDLAPPSRPPSVVYLLDGSESWQQIQSRNPLLS